MISTAATIENDKAVSAHFEQHPQQRVWNKRRDDTQFLIACLAASIRRFDALTDGRDA
ncbi:MAG: hypothetical protein JNJ73_07980 [Hyphomonadaceae bacterium]|nr:hypothetical protein [Hyphomonadaceae bacterium]